MTKAHGSMEVGTSSKTTNAIHTSAARAHERGRFSATIELNGGGRAWLIVLSKKGRGRARKERGASDQETAARPV